ncbi:uncharacterized protein LOC144449870 [Glandiceps talaboti]
MAETEEELKALLEEMERSFLSSMAAGKIEGMDEMDNFTFLDILNKEEKEVLLNKKIEDMRKKNERLMKRHKEIQDDKRYAKDIGAEIPDELPLPYSRGSPQSPENLGHIPKDRGGGGRGRGGGGDGRSGRSGGGRGRGYASKRGAEPYRLSRTEGDQAPRMQGDMTPRRVGSGRTEHSRSVNRRGGYGRQDSGGHKSLESSRGQGSRVPQSPKSPKSPKSPPLSPFVEDDNPMVGMTITVTNSAIAASRQKKSILCAPKSKPQGNITVSLNMQGKKGEPRRIVKMTKEEKEQKEWEEKRKQNIQAMEEELKALNEFETHKTGKAPKPYNFLDDSKRDDSGESRRNFRNWGGNKFDEAKSQMTRHRAGNKDYGPPPGSRSNYDMTMSMTGRERREYSDWKAERERIDQERLLRHKKATGEWRREWDRAKFDDDGEPIGRSGNRGDRIGSGRFDNRGQRQAGKKGKFQQDATKYSPPNKDGNAGYKDWRGKERSPNDSKKRGPSLTIPVTSTPTRKYTGSATSPDVRGEEVDRTAISPGNKSASPLSGDEPISPGVLKTPTDHVHVDDWAAEMEEASQNSQEKGEEDIGMDGKEEDDWGEDHVDKQFEGGDEHQHDMDEEELQQEFDGEVTEDIIAEMKGVDLGPGNSQDAALSETGDSFESFKSADSEPAVDERGLAPEQSQALSASEIEAETSELLEAELTDLSSKNETNESNAEHVEVSATEIVSETSEDVEKSDTTTDQDVTNKEESETCTPADVQSQQEQCDQETKSTESTDGDTTKSTENADGDTTTIGNETDTEKPENNTEQSSTNVQPENDQGHQETLSAADNTNENPSTANEETKQSENNNVKSGEDCGDSKSQEGHAVSEDSSTTKQENQDDNASST